MSRYPDLRAYNQALQYPVTAFIDPHLKTGVIKTNLLGQPMPYGGGLAFAYRITCGDNKIVVRCFHKEVEALETRYWAISKYLRQLASPYFVNFELQNPGIVVQGEKYPIIKMDWAQGVSLSSFLASNLYNIDALNNLEKSIFALADFLEKNRISHGNIEPGNFLISNEGQNICLIDYDAFYLDEIKPLGCREVGLRNFQHPERTIDNWGPNLDRFSLILLHTSIEILKRAPHFWQESQSDRDSILFTANDLETPENSVIFQKLSQDNEIAPIIKNFREVCEAKFKNIPSLENFGSRPLEVAARKPKMDYIGNYPVLDALDYDACLKHVGETIELVGCIKDIKQGFTKHGKPYYFLNFSDWRGNAVKITIWKNLFRKSKFQFENLTNLYVSVIGLLEPPYTTDSYSHLSITLTDSTPFKVITQQEAAYRLNRPLRQEDQKTELHPGSRLYAKLEKASDKLSDKIEAEIPKETSISSANTAFAPSPPGQQYVPPSPVSNRPVQTPASYTISAPNSAVAFKPWTITYPPDAPSTPASKTVQPSHASASSSFRVPISDREKGFFVLGLIIFLIIALFMYLPI